MTIRTAGAASCAAFVMGALVGVIVGAVARGEMGRAGR